MIVCITPPNIMIMEYSNFARNNRIVSLYNNYRREALEIWKQKLGSPTYNDLIGVFERAGYDDYVGSVKEIFCEFQVIIVCTVCKCTQYHSLL